MKSKTLSCIILLLVSALSLAANNQTIRERLMGAAYLDNQAYHLLEEMSDLYGGRMTGSESNELSMVLLENALKKQGIESHREYFTFPGWERKEDEALLLYPIKRKLRAVAMGYVQPHPTFAAELALIDKAKLEDISTDVDGKVGLVPANVTLNTSTVDALVAERGLKGLLLINRRNGGQLLARTQRRGGAPSPIPVYSITEEEGHWFKRLIERDETPRVQLTTRSDVKSMRTPNLVARLPGKVAEKIVIGAHFDSWDLGQGALDNGVGIVQAYDVARLLKSIHPDNHFTLEFVWFNAEELGLFGSYAYMDKHKDDKIVAMYNMDMVGDPIGINAMGFDSLVPILERFSSKLEALSFTRKMDNKPWLGGDHMPFILQGIPSITLYAPFKPEASKFYHDFADTFDKVDKTHLSKSIAIISLLMYELANSPELSRPRLTQEEVITLLRKAKLEERMKQSNTWPFEE